VAAAEVALSTRTDRLQHADICWCYDHSAAIFTAAISHTACMQVGKPRLMYCSLSRSTQGCEQGLE
jgi:hypothetical protein